MKTDFDKGSVILLHGLGRSKSVRKTVETYLKACGYTVWNIMRISVYQTIHRRLIKKLYSSGSGMVQKIKANPIHFVTHLYGHRMQGNDMIDMGLKSLKWLVAVYRSPIDQHRNLYPVSCHANRRLLKIIDFIKIIA